MRGWRIFSILGIDVEINYSWLIILVLLALGMSTEYLVVVPGVSLLQAHVAGAVTSVLLFACILIHELGHSLAARQYGIDVARITLFLFGGVAQTRREVTSAASEIVIAAAGPVTSLVLAGLFQGLALLADRTGAGLLAATGAHRLAIINAMLAVFNLLPAFPLDGGRILRAALWEWWRDVVRSTRVATGLGRLLGAALVAVGIYIVLTSGWVAGLWYLALGWLLAGAAQQAYQGVRLREALRRIPVAEAMNPVTVTVPPEASVFAVMRQYLMPLRLPAIAVASNGEVSGLLTEEAIRKHPQETWPHLKVSQVATPLEGKRLVIADTADLGQALDELAGGEVPSLVVVEEQTGTLVGILSRDGLVTMARLQGRG